MHVIEFHDALLGATTDDEGVEALLPCVRVLLLEAVFDFLAEQAVAVEQAVAGHRIVLRHGRVEEAGGQAAQATVTQRGIVLSFQDVDEILAICLRDLDSVIDKPQVCQVVQQRTAHEELGGEVRLLAGRGVGRTGGIPVIGELLHCSQGKTSPELLAGCGLRSGAGDRANMATNSASEGGWGSWHIHVWKIPLDIRWLCL